MASGILVPGPGMGTHPLSSESRKEVLTIGPPRGFQDLTHFFFFNHETCELGGIVEIIHFDPFQLRVSKQLGPGDVMIWPKAQGDLRGT